MFKDNWLITGITCFRTHFFQITQITEQIVHLTDTLRSCRREILVPLMLELQFCCLILIWQHKGLSPSLPKTSVRPPPNVLDSENSHSGVSIPLAILSSQFTWTPASTILELRLSHHWRSFKWELSYEASTFYARVWGCVRPFGGGCCWEGCCCCCPPCCCCCWPAAWLDIASMFFRSCASQCLVDLSSFKQVAKVSSFSWSGRHWQSASQARVLSLRRR